MQLSLGKKIAFGQTTVFFLFILFSLFIFFSLSAISRTNIKYLRKNFVHYSHSKEIKLHIVQIQQFLSDIGATRGENGLDDGLEEAAKHYHSLLSNIESEKKNFTEDNNLKMAQELDEIKKLADVYYTSGVTMAKLYIAQGTTAGNTYMPNFDNASLDLQKKVESFSLKVSEDFVNEINSIIREIERMLRFSIWIPLLALIVFSVFSYHFIKRLTGQLVAVTEELNQAVPQLMGSSNSMNSLSENLSSFATEQAAAVQETAASLEEISAMINRNSDNANSAKASSLDSLNSVKNGQRALADMLLAIDEIGKNNNSFNEFTNANNKELNEMVRLISEIADKTKVINDIVFQTKLLSFNASVEAARAGEHGKGFAVVAEEIGNLAQMSGTAANEIRAQLDESIVKVNQIVSSTKSQVGTLINDGREKIEMGVAKAKQCDAALAEINNTSTLAESLVSEVANASIEQSQGVNEVNKAMGQIDEVTGQNTIASQNIFANSSQLLQLSNSIRNTSDKLLYIIKGTTA